MRIVDKVQFTLGVFDIVVGIGITIAAIILHRYTKIVFTLFPVGIGIMALFRSIETRKHRQEKEELATEECKRILAKYKNDDLK